MNRHFKDSQYYVRRAAATAKRGVVEEFAPVRERIARLRGEEDETEAEGRFEQAQARIKADVRRGKARVARLVTRGRERVRGAAE